MGKVSLSVLLFSVFLLSSSCSVMNQNVIARKNLAKCKYKVKKVNIVKINFSDEIQLDPKNLIHLNSKESTEKIVRFLDQIRKRNFRIRIKSVDVSFELEIRNTTSHEVALDHVLATVYFDKRKFATLKHERFVRIKSGSVLEELILSTVPFDKLNQFSFKPKTATVEAVAFVNILIGPYTLKTPYSITIRKTFTIPYDKIKAIIQKKKDELINRMVKKADQFLKKKVKKGFLKKVRKKVF